MTHASQLLRYLTVGASGFAVDALFYLGLDACLAGLSPASIRFIAFIVASTWNWYLNRHWTFRDRLPTTTMPGKALEQWMRFLVSSLASGLLTAAIFAWLHDDHAWPGLCQLWPLFLSTLPAGLTGFALSIYWVYGSSEKKDSASGTLLRQD